MTDTFEDLEKVTPKVGANVYLLGNGLLASISQGREDALDLLLMDEKEGEHMPFSTLVAKVGKTTTQFANITLSQGAVERPTDTLANVATVLSQSQPAERSQVYDWDAARRSALSATPKPELDIDAIRGLIEEINQAV